MRAGCNDLRWSKDVIVGFKVLALERGSRTAGHRSLPQPRQHKHSLITSTVE